MAAVTRLRIAGLTPYASRSTFETAARETPATAATSRIVGARSSGARATPRSSPISELIARA